MSQGVRNQSYVNLYMGKFMLTLSPPFGTLASQRTPTHDGVCVGVRIQAPVNLYMVKFMLTMSPRFANLASQ